MDEMYTPASRVAMLRVSMAAGPHSRSKALSAALLQKDHATTTLDEQLEQAFVIQPTTPALMTMAPASSLQLSTHTPPAAAGYLQSVEAWD